MVRSDGQLGSQRRDAAFGVVEERLSALSKRSDPLGAIAALVPCENLRTKFFELARPTSEAANRDCP
jgi:hypothetical protein